MVELSFADAEAPGVDGVDAAEPPTAPGACCCRAYGSFGGSLY
jgi:hypothetical protein